jgi:glyoxylase-like metal-dependent hydrolase (beta-lactamase superfamily II)
MRAYTISLGLLAAFAADVSPAQPLSPRTLLEQAAAAMGGLERIQSLDNIVLTGFGLAASQQGGGNLSPDPRAPQKWQATNYVQRTFDLRNERLRNETRNGNLFPFAARSGHAWAPSTQIQTGVDILDHPLTALLEALDPETKLGAVHTEGDDVVVELTIEQGDTLEIALDGRTRLPTWVRWVSGSSTLGDVTSTAYFTGYLPHDGVELPTGITTAIDWRDTTVEALQVDSYRVNARDVPAVAAPAPRAAAGTPPPKAESRLVAPRVWDVRYGGNGGAVIEFRDHLTMFEAYANETATFARIDLANTLVRGKQVTEVIVSHHHFDHSGGLRAAVARGLTVISRRSNEQIFREMVARPAARFPDALARNPQPLKFVAVDEHLALDDGTMRVDVYRVVGHLHMAEAVFAYVPGPRIFLEGDFTTQDWDFNWWGAAYLDNVERYDLDPAINIPVHGVVTTFDETIASIERQVENARQFCAENERGGIYMAGCPIQYSRRPR